MAHLHNDTNGKHSFRSHWLTHHAVILKSSISCISVYRWSKTAITSQSSATVDDDDDDYDDNDDDDANHSQPVSAALRRDNFIATESRHHCITVCGQTMRGLVPQSVFVAHSSGRRSRKYFRTSVQCRVSLYSFLTPCLSLQSPQSILRQLINGSAVSSQTTRWTVNLIL